MLVTILDFLRFILCRRAERSERACSVCIQMTGYLNDRHVRDLADYFKALRENRATSSELCDWESLGVKDERSGADIYKCRRCGRHAASFTEPGPAKWFGLCPRRVASKTT